MAPDLPSSRKAELLNGEIKMLSAQMEIHGCFIYGLTSTLFFFL